VAVTRAPAGLTKGQIHRILASASDAVAFTLIECSFPIPVTRDRLLSDGDLHSPLDWSWLNDELFVRFGGATIAPGEHEVFYADPTRENGLVIASLCRGS
jgi:hypothetical protein